MNDKNKVFLTEEGKEELEKELKNLRDVVRPKVIEELKEARAQGDLSENADYDAARKHQAEVESKISSFEAMLDRVSIIKPDKRSGAIKLGSNVLIKYLNNKTEFQFKIVGTVEADPFEGKISNEATLAKAILNHHEGEEIEVKAEKPYKIKIIKVN